MNDLISRNPDGSTEGIVPTRDDLAGLHEAKPILAVIRAKCLDCCCGQVVEVRRCTCVKCPLWPYRMGRNPFRLGQVPANGFVKKNPANSCDGFEDGAS